MTDPSLPGGTVGEKIRALLTDRGMSQRQLAAMLAATDGGASERQIENMRRQVSSWINDAHAPSPENAARIADALDVPAEWFIEDQPRRSLAGALEELADVVGLLTAEAARSEEATRIVLALDRRLQHNEALLRQLIEGQETGTAALGEILERLDAYESGAQDRRRPPETGGTNG